MDLMLQWNGNLNEPMVTVEAVKLNMATSEDGKSCGNIALSTHENFLWALVDVAEGVSEVSDSFEKMTSVAEEVVVGDGGGDNVDWDEVQAKASGDYAAALKAFSEARTEKLFNFKLVTLAQVALVVSFKRRPKKERYKDKARKVGAGGALVEYATKSLKFEVKEAKLKFSGYQTKNIKGGLDKLMDVIIAVYTDKIKYKWFELASSISLNEWKTLTGRSDGSDKYKDGDFFRAAGNIAGVGSSFVVTGLTSGIANEFSSGVSKIGDKFEKGTAAMGLGKAGAGVNSVVSGVGDGIGSTVHGLGTGVGGTVVGIGKGAGQIFGGLGGGLHSIGKGMKKGIVDGDGEGFLQGLEGGATSIAGGIGGGLETALVGVGDGVMSIGGGLFKGIGKIGKGVIGGVNGNGGKDAKAREKEKAKAKKEAGGGGGKARKSSFFG
jgi:hypothetical protein